MMKPGTTKLLFIALSCLTLASGCTKKKSNNSSKAPEKIEAKSDPTGPIKSDPKPTPPKNDEVETPSPAGTTPIPAPDTKKSTPEKQREISAPTKPPESGATATVTVPSAIPPKPEQNTAAKPDLETYEECVAPSVANILETERSKNAELIEAKTLFETKLTILKKCQKPASISSDVAETLVTKKIIDFAEVKFVDAEGFVEAFYEIERQQLPETERRKIYEQISAEANVPQQPKALTTPTPQTIAQPAAIAPKVAAEPVKETGIKKETKLITDFKKCFKDTVTPGIAVFKTDNVEIISPRDLFELKLSALSLCDFDSTKEPKLNEYMTKLMTDILNKDFPKSNATVKMFADIEKQNLAIEAKRAAYDKLGKEAKIESKFDKQKVSAPAAKTNEKEKPPTTAPATNETKDLVSIEKCLDSTIETLIAAEKKKKTELEHPIEIFALEKTLTQQCKIKETAETKAARSKILQHKVLAHYPNSKDKLTYVQAVDKITANDQLKIKLFQLYNFYLEIEEKNSMLRGALAPEQTSGNTIAYTIKNFGGETLTKIQAPGKKLATNKGASDNIQPEGLLYIFDFTAKENKTSTLTVKLAETTVATLDFTLAQGTLADLKANKSVVIALTASAWKKVWELRWRQQLMITVQESEKFPLKFSMDAAKGTLPLCELKATELACSDPDLSVKMKVTTEALNLQ